MRKADGSLVLLKISFFSSPHTNFKVCLSFLAMFLIPALATPWETILMGAAVTYLIPFYFLCLSKQEMPDKTILAIV